jgi:PAS domain S-box-containing protein
MSSAALSSDGTAAMPLRVLFFEDHTADIELALCALESAGFEVTADVAVTPEQVSQRVRSGSYDVILSDYRMPCATGMDVFSALKAEHIQVPFILLTGSLGDEKAVECLKEGVADYVLKDRLARLPLAIRRALEEKRLREGRARAEEALRRSEASYRSLVDSATFAIFRLSATDDRFLAVNPALAEMLGYARPSDLMQLELSRDVYADPGAVQRLLRACAEPGSLIGGELEWKRLDGKPIAVRLSGRILSDSAGGAFFEMVAENVTARKCSEERIRQLNRLYSVLSHVSQAIVRLRDRDQLCREICRIAVEEGHFQMAWIGMREPRSDRIRPLVHWGREDDYLNALFVSAADEPAGRGPVGRSFRTGEHSICDDTQNDPDFAPWREPALRCGYRAVGGFPLSVQGNAIGVIALYAAASGFFDPETVGLLDELAAEVSLALERMHLAELRQRAVEELNQFFILSQELLCIGQMDGRIHRLNPAWEKTLGFTAAELQSMPLSELVHRDDLTEALTAIGKLRSGIEIDQIEIRCRSKRGPYRWLLCNATPVHRERLQQQDLLFIAARDITDRKNLEMQLLQRNVALDQQNQRVEAATRMKSEFLANMSHELRSPLNGIIGFAELLYDGRLGPVADRQKDLLGRILSSSRHLLHLINDVLDLARVEAGRLEFRAEPIQMPKLVREVISILEKIAADKQIRLETEIDPAVSAVLADPARLKQVLYNYLSNALKFTAAGGAVVVQVKPEGAAEFRLEVSDTGVGIAEENLPRLFVEFQQLDAGAAKRFQGTGLGLAFSKRIVEAQGGRVGVTSTVGQGSTFYAILPRSPLQPHTSRRAPRILVVEDERIERLVLTAILQHAGCVVQTASTGAEALAKCGQEAFDLVTLDWLLPDTSGSDLLRQMRSMPLHHDTPVLAISMIEEMRPGVDGIQEVVRKPVDGPALLAAMARSGVAVQMEKV